MKKLISQIEQLRENVISLEGWSRRLVAMFLGLGVVLALPPLHVWPMLVPGFVGLAWLIDGSRATKQPTILRFTGSPSWAAFSVGWWFGVGFFSAGLYWVSFSFLVDAKNFAWMIPVALFCLSAGMALYIGFASFTTYITSSSGARRILALALWWVIFEWIRSWIFTGFPWNLLGTIWTVSDSMIQVTSVTGVFGLSLFTVLAAVAPAILGEDRVLVPKRCAMTFLSWALLAVVWVGGYIRLNGATETNVDSVILRLVQPNIAQRDKWKPHLQRQHFDKLLGLSSRLGDKAAPGPTHIIWPETATPIYLSSVKDALRIVSTVVPIGGALLTGAPRQISTPGGPIELWNSVHVIDSSARIRGTYDKYHLVPFGEYVPFRKYLKIASLTGGRKDFSRGAGQISLAVPGAPSVIPLICYEAIFPLQVRLQEYQRRPGWLLNVTNDAWFGLSSGPYQHFAATRLRTVEIGLPLVRVANTGLSGIIDAYGRVVTRTRLNETISLDSPLPAALPNLTWFAKYGNTTFFALVILLFLISRLNYFSSQS